MKTCQNCRYNPQEMNVKWPCIDCLGHDRWEANPPSNADRIRAMTDEELAEWIGWVTQDAYCFGAKLREQMMLFPFGERDTTLGWLKQEAESDN